MKPRWHLIKLTLEGFDRKAWMKPLENQLIAISDGKVRRHLPLQEFQRLVAENLLSVGSALPLKEHMALDETLAKIQLSRRPSVTGRMVPPIKLHDYQVKVVQQLKKELPPMRAGVEFGGYRTVDKFEPFEVSLVDMSNGRNPCASPIDLSKEVK